MRAHCGVHLGIRPYTDDCHTDKFVAPIAPMFSATSTGFNDIALASRFRYRFRSVSAKEADASALAYRLQAPSTTGCFDGNCRVVCGRVTAFGGRHRRPESSDIRSSDAPGTWLG
jgi:hypothetical protein